MSPTHLDFVKYFAKYGGQDASLNTCEWICGSALIIGFVGLFVYVGVAIDFHL